MRCKNRQSLNVFSMTVAWRKGMRGSVDTRAIIPKNTPSATQPALPTLPTVRIGRAGLPLACLRELACQPNVIVRDWRAYLRLHYGVQIRLARWRQRDLIDAKSITTIAELSVYFCIELISYCTH